MKLNPYQLKLLYAVYRGDSAALKQEYSQNGDMFVLSMYQLHQHGLVTTHRGNFHEGGDKLEPEDVVVPEAFFITPLGLFSLFEATVKT